LTLFADAILLQISIVYTDAEFGIMNCLKNK